MMPTPRIILTGFMCAGKTTVAAALAARTGGAWLDLDELVATRIGRSVQAIIDADGEAQFRALETAALRAVLADADGAQIIALGGGTWTVAPNRALIAAHPAVVVWLDAPFELCWQRIVRAGDTRPLARAEAAARRRYAERRPLYAQAALHVPVSAAQTAAELAAVILARLDLTSEI